MPESVVIEVDRASRVENVVFVAVCALLTCAVFVTYVLSHIGVLPMGQAELVREEEAVPPTSSIGIVRRYEAALESVRTSVTDFSRMWFPGYDILLESNTNMTIASNRALYDAAFGDGYAFLPVATVGEGNVFLDREWGFLFIMEPDARKDPDGAVALINDIARRHPELHTYTYLVPPLWLTPLMQDRDPMFISPFYLADAIDKFSPSVRRGALQHNDIEHYLSQSFKTDHHWNMAGAYQGYTDVIRLMSEVYPDIGDPLPLHPERAQTVDGFRGLLSSLSAYDGSWDTISDGGIETAPHTIYVTAPSGTIMEFPSVAQTRQKLFDGTYVPGKYEDLYESFFMPTSLYLWYDYQGNRTGRKLLVMADSMRKSIVEPLASHFDQTYVVDVRYREDFIFDSFVEEHGITDVLFMYGDSFNDLSRLYADCF